MIKTICISISCLVFFQEMVLQAQVVNPPKAVTMPEFGVQKLPTFVARTDERAKALPPSEESLSWDNIGEPGTVSVFPAITISNNILLNQPQPWSPEGSPIYLLSKTVVNSELAVNLFEDNGLVDLEALYITTDPDVAISFQLDKLWHRIVYSQKNGNWIRSYGDKPGDYQFMSPRGMSIDVNDTIYVADTENNRIVKLKFNRTTALIEYVGYFTLPNLQHPVDIAIDQSGTLAQPSNPANDYIWIADDVADRLIVIRRSGTVVTERTTYSGCCGINKPVSNPVQVLPLEGTKRVGFIDGTENAFVVLNSQTYSLVSFTQFDQGAEKLVSVGADINDEWWVADVKSNKYHHFTRNGSYLASYWGVGSPSGVFTNLKTASKSPYVKVGSVISRSQYNYASDQWGQNSGLRAYFPGTDAIQLQYVPLLGSCNGGISFKLLNQSKVKGKLKKSDGSVLRTYDYASLQAGTQTVPIEAAYVGNASYWFDIELLPQYWSSYGIGPEQWATKTLNFNGTRYESWGAMITASSQCVTGGQWGTWTAQPNCSGPWKYKWYRNTAKGSSTWIDLYNTNQSISFMVGTSWNTNFELKCEITNDVPSGLTKSVYYENCPPPPPPPPLVSFCLHMGWKEIY